jgi:hypothetical protein
MSQRYSPVGVAAEQRRRLVLCLLHAQRRAIEPI